MDSVVETGVYGSRDLASVDPSYQRFKTRPLAL